MARQIEHSDLEEVLKILFLDHPQFTSGSQWLWQGLTEILGPESVAVYPYIPTHYDALRVNLSDLSWFREMEAIAERGELPAGIPPMAPGERITGGQTEIPRYRYLKPIPLGPDITEAQAVQMLNAGYFQLIVLANSHRVPTIALARLRERVKSLPPIVYYDAGERDELNEHWVHAFRPKLVFKQILTPAVLSKGLSVKIHGYTLTMLPLPLSSPMVDWPSVSIGLTEIGLLRQMDEPYSKILDVFHSMGPTWPSRPGVVAALDEFCHAKRLNWVKAATYENYMLLLAKSRVAVTMRGSGRDTQRYWEIPCFRTLMLADGTMGCFHPYAFEDGKTASFYSSLGELLEKVERYALGGAEAERDRIALAGKEHLARYHTTAARAVFFLDRVQEYLGAVDPVAMDSVARWKASKGWDERDWRSPALGGNL